MTTDMKAAIEKAKSDGNCNQREWWMICELAEIGRLAVEVHQHTKGTDPLATHAAADLLDDACTAFLARLEGGK